VSQSRYAELAHDQPDRVVTDRDVATWRSSAVTLSAPYVPPEALWTSAISPASQIRRKALGEAGRSFHA
jgi:hypothetical protein